MASTQNSYLNAAAAYDSEKPDPKYFAQSSVNSATLGSEVGQINGDSTGFTATETLEDKQKQSTDGGCGTSFTTATDPAKINVKQSLGGHVTKVETVNSDGDPLIKIMTSDGKSVTFDEDGSVIFTTAKRNNDPLSGRFDVRSQGSTRLKVGESLLIEVENKNNVVASKDGSTKSSKAFSLVVYGNVDITAHDGEINAKAKNITLNATNELTLQAGSKISLLSGKGKGQSNSTTTSSNTQSSSQVEYGGLIEFKGGDINIDGLTVRQNSSVDYKIVSHEGATLSSEKLANYGFQSPGSFTLDISGDFAELIGGLKRTEIYAKSDAASTILPGQTDGWYTSVAAVKGDAFVVEAASGGVYMHTTKGDMIVQTDSGSVLMDSTTAGGFSALDKANPAGNSKPLSPGVYLRGYNKSVYIGTSQGDICIGIGSAQQASTVTNGIKITAAKLEIKNSTGIYLN